MTSNRRQFSRISFQAKGHLLFPSGDCAVEVLDLSLKGALIEPSSEFFAVVGSHCTLKIPLDGGGSSIRMEATIVHHQGVYYGLACREIDLDSVTHLRRLVALNLGDDASLERELALLSRD